LSIDATLLWAPLAWVGDAWRERVLLRAGADGRWADIAVDTPAPAHASVLAGPALPGMVDAHSHAFQRAFAGLAERREGAHDDFWSWRDGMYRVASRITPAQLQAVAAQLYAELLQGGYTQVCEFHYLQHQPDGSPYGDPLALGLALADAAEHAGIGLTVLPALYERAGFDGTPLSERQQRFRADADFVWTSARRLRSLGRPLLGAGVAIHSLRAAGEAQIRRLQQLAEGDGGPIHIHVAEQMREVDDCLATTGARPIERLAQLVALDARWQLVHATHAQPLEMQAVARAGAGVVLCPGTEANLGDGIVDLPGWTSAGAALSIGSDSQVSRGVAQELQLLEYSQRLSLRRRNVAAEPRAGMASSAERLYSQCLQGGARAAGFEAWGLVGGARADLVVLDPADSALLGLPAVRALDAWVFSGAGTAVRDVMVNARWVVREGAHVQAQATRCAFVAAMQELTPSPACGRGQG